MVTGKVHIMSHLVGEILKFGMNPNHSSTIFESSFNKDKQMAKESKNNLMPAIRNNTGLQSSLSLFNHLSDEQLNYLGCSLTI